MNNDTKQPRIYLTLRETADLLIVKPRTVYAWVADNRIPFERKGGLLRFRLDLILAWNEPARKQTTIQNHRPPCYPKGAPVKAATGKEHDVGLQAKR